MSARTSRREVLGAGAFGAIASAGGALLGAIAEHQLVDGPLLAACSHFRELEATYRRLTKTEDVTPPTAESLAAEAALEAMRDDYDGTMQTIADLPARTTQGLRAKAQSLVAFHGSARDYGDHYTHKRVEWSLICDVAGKAAA